MLFPRNLGSPATFTDSHCRYKEQIDAAGSLLYISQWLLIFSRRHVLLESVPTTRYMYILLQHFRVSEFSESFVVFSLNERGIFKKQLNSHAGAWELETGVDETLPQSRRVIYCFPLSCDFLGNHDNKMLLFWYGMYYQSRNRPAQVTSELRSKAVSAAGWDCWPTKLAITWITFVLFLDIDLKFSQPKCVLTVDISVGLALIADFASLISWAEERPKKEEV